MCPQRPSNISCAMMGHGGVAFLQCNGVRRRVPPRCAQPQAGARVRRQPRTSARRSCQGALREAQHLRPRSRRAPAAQRAARRAHAAPQERQDAHDARTELARTKLGQPLYEVPFAAGGSAHCGAMSGRSASSGPRGTNGKARGVFILTRVFATRIKRWCAGGEQEDSIISFTHMRLVRHGARTADQVH